tara:strand:- start:3028 stop:3381 length:354 start_codon:yes stop_codon:yes gene_type:complete
MITNTAFLIIMQSSIFRLDGPEIDILDALQTLCDCINNDPMETDWSIGESLECSLDDLIVGAYWAFTECHAGQCSQSYSVMCTIGSIFSPGCTSLAEDECGEKTAHELICKELLKAA